MHGVVGVKLNRPDVSSHKISGLSIEGRAGYWDHRRMSLVPQQYFRYVQGVFVTKIIISTASIVFVSKLAARGTHGTLIEPSRG